MAVDRGLYQIVSTLCSEKKPTHVFLYISTETVQIST